MKMRAFALIVVIVLAVAGLTFGQSITLESVTGLHNVDTVLVGQEITFSLRIVGTPSTHGGITNGFKVYSPEGATWDTLYGDTLPLGWGTWFDLVFAINPFSTDGQGADTVGFGGVKLFNSGLPANFDAVSYTITIGPIDSVHHGKTIVLDSSYFRPIGIWKWAGPDAFPTWGGPYTFTIFNPNAPPEPSNLVVTPDSLYFSAIQGGSQPASQEVTVDTDRDPLTFSVVENTSWIVVSPTQATTPTDLMVSANTIGLTAGTYIDSVQIVSASAGNSPQWFKVVLDLLPPPPIIATTPSSFVFNAIAGGSNPAPKILTITNTGQSQLNWSVSNSESWLSLNPTSGVDSGDVELSIDITGLPFGDYFDTVVVSDPNATNSPRRIPVTLTVASDLPVIAVDSANNYIIVPTGVPSVPNREFYIYNAGGGTMNFTLSETSSRILSLTPSSGTAPLTVSAAFKVAGGMPGNDYYDTVWVNSSEAINSPFPIVFRFHYVDQPALISISKDTLRLTVYECTMGYDALLPVDYFTVANGGGDNPLVYECLYESDYFDLDFPTGTAPQFVTLTANYLNLPLGVYYDTILVVAENATNSPRRLTVKYSVVEGVVDPQILVSANNIIVPTQENEGPVPEAAIGIFNRFGGCMSWNVNEVIPWMFPTSDTGTAPSSLGLIVNAGSFTLGTYPDSFYVEAPGATNDPVKVRIEMRVWRFHGDCDWNGVLNIADLVYFVDFFFGSGPAPVPEWRVGNMNCDHKVDIADLVYFVDYMFAGGPIPCGNPFK